MRYLCALLVLITAYTASGQSLLIDSLEKQLQTRKLPDTLRIDYLNLLAREYTYISTAQATRYAHQALEQSQRLHYKRGEAYGYRNLASSYSAQEYFHSTAEFMGKAMQLFEELRDTVGLGNCYITLGHTYRRQQEFRKSVESHAKAVAIFRGNKLKERMGVSIHNLGESQLLAGDLKAASNSTLEAIAINTEIENLPVLTACYMVLGIIQYKEKNYREAEISFRQALALSQSLGKKSQKIATVQSLLYMAKLSHLNNQPDAEYRYLREAIRIAREHNLPTHMREASIELIDHYLHKKDLRAARLALEDYAQLSDNLIRTLNQEKAAMLEPMITSIKREAENKQLYAERQLNKQLIERQKSQLLFYLIITLLLITALGLFFYFTVQHRRTLQKVSSLSDKLGSVLDSSISGIMAFDAVRNETGSIAGFACSMVNRRAVEITGLPEEQLLGKCLPEIMPGNMSEDMFSQFLRVVETGDTLNLEYYFMSGPVKTWLHVVAVKLENGFVVTFSDITVARNAEENLKAVVRDLKRSEEELQHRGEELLTVNESMELTIRELHQTQAQLVQSEKMASLGQLTAGIAHEINNPINFVYSGVDNLRRSLDDIFQILTAYESLEAETEPDLKLAALENIARLKQDLFYEENKEMIGQTLHAIRYGASRTAEIVKGLRNFSRLDEADLKVADVHEGLNSALILLTHQFKDRVDVIREYDPEVPAIECYAGQLNQVFMNLLSNAVQAIDNKGWIRIFTRNEPDSVIIEISDSGKGIPADVQSRVFEPFFTTKEVGQGTGLGLSISYGIIGKHRGQISFRSAPGEGTTFTIVLPKSLQPAKAPVLH